MNYDITDVEKKISYWTLPLFMLISFLFLLVFSGTTSPLYAYSGVDSSIFVLMGKMFLEGKTPYVDFFDHKGPILIFIEALGLAPFSGEKTGVFVLQVVNLTIIQTLIFYIARTFLSTINSISVILLSLLVFSLSIDGGNLTEEYSLPFTLICLLFAIQYYYSDKISWTKPIVIGFCIACLFWLRINNMGVICACVLYIFIISIKKKDWVVLKRLVFGALIGFLIITVPLILYFLYKNALYEMIYATFIFNLKYINYGEEMYVALLSPVLYVLKYWTVFIVLIAGTMLYCYHRKDRSLSLLSLLLIFFGLVGTRFGLYVTHYMTLNIPLLALGLSLLLYTCGNLLPKRIITLSVLVMSCFLLSGYTIWKYNNSYYREGLDDSVFISAAHDVVSQIPDAEKDSLYPYNVQSKFFLYTGVDVYYRYFIFQEWHGVHDSQIYDSVNEMMRTHPPLWIILTTDNTTEAGYAPKNKLFYNVLKEEYNPYYRNEQFILYRKIDT